MEGRGRGGGGGSWEKGGRGGGERGRGGVSERNEERAGKGWGAAGGIGFEVAVEKGRGARI